MAVDTIEGLSGEQRNAYDVIRSALENYDLESLADEVLHYIQEGFSGDTIMLQLQDTREWKTRFAANELRKKNGLPLLTPDEIISTEASYRQVLRMAGFPPGFYDQPDDFVRGIGNDQSPAELQRKVTAQQAVFDQHFTGVADYFQQHYGIDRGGSFAYFIDPTRAAPLLEKQARAAEIGAAAFTTRFGDLSTQTAERLAERGITADQAQQGFGELAPLEQTLTRQLPGQAGPTVTAEDLIAAGFENDADAVKKIEAAKGTKTSEFGDSGGFATTKQGFGGLGSASQQ